MTEEFEKNAHPAHFPVMWREVARELVREGGGVYVDATFGRGGHSRIILRSLSPEGRLIAFDRDPEAAAAAAAISDPRFTMVRAPFSTMEEELGRLGLGARSVSGILMDLGVSSPQIDEPERGFSFRLNGPLDMRMDPTSGMSAAEWLATAPREELERVIADYGEERHAARIARTIAEARRSTPFRTTGELAALVASCVPRSRRDDAQHPATRTFQAIRIRVNGELDELSRALPAAGRLLAPRGRLAVISFHSLEDRMAKRFLEAASRPSSLFDPRLPLRESEMPAPLFRNAVRLKPGAGECAENVRSRSAVLRVAERTEEPWRDVFPGRRAA